MTDRDLYLLDVLAAHRVLTAEQVAALLYPSVDRAQRRLLALTRRGALERFRARVYPGSQAWRYTLSYPAVQLLAAGRAERPMSRSAHNAAVLRLARSGTLEHQLGVNGFFTSLARDAAARPGTRLASWYSESTVYDVIKWQYQLAGSVRPDGYGRWIEGSRTTTFFVEHDRGTESLERLSGKIAAYGTHYPGMTVLFHLHSALRETHFHHKLLGAGREGIATTTAELLAASGEGASGPVWLAGAAGTRRRLRLSELPNSGFALRINEFSVGTAPIPAPHLPEVA
ncbi:replication-relaxation family protein [Parafrankia elaeagni]|uniref:replication-relaxation family protein n=1 Tax=Parafrankia elaeagni TaxID=222534 RepID=UPI0018A86309|nr:replication-relaxation family protein [Parafrankia elaeagni]